MKWAILLAICVALVNAIPLTLPGVSLPPLTAPNVPVMPPITSNNIIPNSYIITIQAGFDIAAFKAKFDELASQYGAGSVKPAILSQFTVVLSVHAIIPDAFVEFFKALPGVKSVEPDKTVDSSDVQNSPVSWGLTRISERNLDLSQPYVYNSAAGEGITAYVIDTGIFLGHSDFEGRAVFGGNFVNGTKDTDTCGHGTHVAATIGGAKYGVAKKVKLVDVKVLGEGEKCGGSISGIIAGLDWVYKNATSGKAVINMSLGCDKSSVIDDAVQKLFQNNIPLIAAAGNTATTNSCTLSPAGSPNVYTVAASDKTDTVAVFSSFGECVEIFGPGVDIVSAGITGPSAEATLSGTSMASPHVAGVAALYLSMGGINSAQELYNKLSDTATKGVIKGDLKGSPNSLVYAPQ
ncbi:hypothetical protein BGZ99_009082 [Dissophora globulifera]|uniref:Peptidase S8/S53 domain-containing protein n=1 Tax=Dissophora globulifera TaxID=979702 RepID=A0A9P6R5I4_9FUNG|nr:hypothetical protein BGZ99_009082 [Dissophora globulifera]